jgi:hypothetical protein
MTIEDIKTQLETHERTFPEAALRAAMAQREAIMPLLLVCLQATADDPHKVAQTDGAMLHLYAMYLLAQFRERAFDAGFVGYGLRREGMSRACDVGRQRAGAAKRRQKRPDRGYGVRDELVGLLQGG